MKRKKVMLCLLPLFLLCVWSFGQKADDSVRLPKVYVVKDTTRWFSRFPQKNSFNRMSKDSVKAEYQRRTGKELDERFLLIQYDSTGHRRKEEIVNP